MESKNKCGLNSSSNRCKKGLGDNFSEYCQMGDNNRCKLSNEINDIYNFKQISDLNSTSFTKRKSKKYGATKLVSSTIVLDSIWNDATYYYNNARNFLMVGNLEEGLANYLLTSSCIYNYIKISKELKISIRKNKNIANLEEINRDNIKESLGMVLGYIESLHTKLEAKKNSFTACFDIEDSKSTQYDCSAVQEVKLFGKHNLSFNSVIGNEEVKLEIINGIVMPYKMPLMYTLQRSFLFYGPPGTGKTLLAKVSAVELQNQVDNLQILFFAPTSDSLKDKHVGGTEKKITSYFRCAQHMAEEKMEQLGKNITVMSIIFIDELDSLARSRSNDPSGVNAMATNAILQMMDGFSALKNIIVIGATNYPWDLDEAILSRFVDKIYVRLPQIDTITKLLEFNIVNYFENCFKDHDILNKSDTKTFCESVRDSQENKLLGGEKLQQFSNPNESQKYHEKFLILSKIIGISENDLNIIAKELYQNREHVTFSPSNIKDVCELVFRKSSRNAREIGIFYKIQYDSESKKSLLEMENSVLKKLEGKYASSKTYTNLSNLYPSLILKTNPQSILKVRRPVEIHIYTKIKSDNNKNTIEPNILLDNTLDEIGNYWDENENLDILINSDNNVQESNSSTESSDDNSEQIDDSDDDFEENRNSFVYAPLWAHILKREEPPLVSVLKQIENYHVYIQKFENFNSKSSIKYVLYRTFKIMYRPGDIGEVQVACHGQLSPSDIKTLLNNNKKSYLQTIYNYLKTKQESILTSNIRTIYVAYEYYSKNNSKNNNNGQYISDYKYKTIFFKALTPNGVNNKYFNDTDSVTELRNINKKNIKVIDRFLWWLTDGKVRSPDKDDSKNKKEKIISSILSTNTITFEYESYNRDEISGLTFNLYLNSMLFFDAIDTEKLDCIRPSSDAKEIKNLEEYSNGSFKQK